MLELGCDITTANVESIEYKNMIWCTFHLDPDKTLLQISAEFNTRF